MSERILVFTPIFFGLYLLLTGLLPQINAKAEKAVHSRAGKKETLSNILISNISEKILPLISIEDMKRQNIANNLRILGEEESPELFQAHAWAAGVFYAISMLMLTPLFHLVTAVMLPDMFSAASIYQVGVVLAVILLFVFHGITAGELEKKMKARREAIEWELPQFSETVLQSLSHTRNVIEILESYRKICGPALKHEIDQTINDMRTGNHETAIKNLAGRINSGSFTQLAQGLIGLLRGDDQISYFQIITKDFSRAQQELIKKELLARPDKLTVNNALLLAGMILMLLVAIGGYLMDTSAGLF